MTVPDGSYIAPGASFTKTWRIRNTGTTTWTTAYRLVFSGGDPLGAPSSVAFPYSVSPGYWMDISVPLRAPNAAGTFQGNWMLQSSDGTLFGVGCCLLYTSDAADDLRCVDLGGRRIIKKKNS